MSRSGPDIVHCHCKRVSWLIAGQSAVLSAGTTGWTDGSCWSYGAGVCSACCSAHGHRVVSGEEVTDCLGVDAPSSAGGCPVLVRPSIGGDGFGPKELLILVVRDPPFFWLGPKPTHLVRHLCHCVHHGLCPTPVPMSAACWVLGVAGLPRPNPSMPYSRCCGGAPSPNPPRRGDQLPPGPNPNPDLALGPS